MKHILSFLMFQYLNYLFTNVLIKQYLYSYFVVLFQQTAIPFAKCNLCVASDFLVLHF